MSVINEIRKRIESLQKGKLIFVSDFIDLGDYETVKKSMQRLVSKDLIIRLSKGIYYYPKIDTVLGIIYPSTDQIAKSIAKRDEARIVPTGLNALHLLGLSSQVPMNIVYLSDGSPRKIKVGNKTIVFKKTIPRNLAVNHRLSNLIIQGLKAIGEKNVTQREIDRIEKIIIQNNQSGEIKENLRYAPIWIRKIIERLLKNQDFEKLAELNQSKKN